MDLPELRIRTVVPPALRVRYPDQQPFVFVAPVPWREGGCDPLSGVSVFAHPSGHLHYVSVGLRDSFGFACDLSFRFACAGAPPAWPVRLLNEFARHAVRRGRSFGPGQYLCLSEPVDPEGAIRCGALVTDPELGEAGWLQVVDVGERELAAIRDDGYEPLLRALAARRPHFVARLAP